MKAYTSSCEECQVRARLRANDRVPIQPVVRPDVPWSRIHVDCIGPIEPASSKQERYALCISDDCSRWPAVFLLKSLTAKAVCEAYIQLFTMTGFPSVIVSDHGTNFTAALTQEFLRRCNCTPRFNSPLRPSSSGQIERFNGTFERMLKHAIKEYGRQWPKAIPFILWGIRSVPNATTGVSPHQLLFGRPPYGPLELIRDQMVGKIPLPERRGQPQSVEKYLEELEINLQLATEFAAEHFVQAQQQYVKYYNRDAKDKHFRVDETVIVLERDSPHKLMSKWKMGKILRKRSAYSYDVELQDGSIRQLHADKLRPYVLRCNHTGIIYDKDVDFGPVSYPQWESNEKNLPSEQINRDALSHLSQSEQEKLLALLDEFRDCFSDKPGLCTYVEHEIEVDASFAPKRSSAYKVPTVLKEEIERQVTELLKLGFIQPSKSPQSSGVVCVVKSDKSIRMACDYRYLNSHTKFDAFPVGNLDDLKHRVGRARYITVCDAKSGYWQIMVKPEHRWLTAFATHHGLWEWRRMPFGLRCATQTFVRCIQKMLEPIKEFTGSYVDDMSTFSFEFCEHMTHLRQYFEVVRLSGLKLNLKKCVFAQCEVTYIGHIIGSGSHRPNPEKTSVIMNMCRPRTKKELRRVLGLFGFYRSYVPHYAAIALPLTEMTRNCKPNELVWSTEAEIAFQTLKTALCQPPVLKVAIPGQPFRLYTDASQNCVGAQLAQVFDSIGEGDPQINVVKGGPVAPVGEHPVAFASFKLTPTQQAWSTIEREAYAVIWALNRFRDMIFWSRITILSDHNPLKFIKEGASTSSKLTRWSLALQEYDINFVYCKAAHQVAADSLSRL